MQAGYVALGRDDAADRRLGYVAVSLSTVCLPMPNFPVRHGALRNMIAAKKVRYLTRMTMAENCSHDTDEYTKESNERKIPEDAALSKHDFPWAASLRFPDRPDLHRLPDGQKSTID